MTARKIEPKGAIQTEPHKGGRPRKLALTLKEQLLARGQLAPWHRKSRLTYLDRSGLAYDIAKASPQERPEMMRRFAKLKGMSEGTASHLLPQMQASAIEIDRQREKMRSLSDKMLAPFQAFELFAARFAAEHETLENWYRGLRFYHQHVWDAALRVARDAAHLDELLSHWQNLPDDTTRDTFVAMLAEVANEN